MTVGDGLIQGVGPTGSSMQSIVVYVVLGIVCTWRFVFPASHDVRVQLLLVLQLRDTEQARAMSIPGVHATHNAAIVDGTCSKQNA